MLVEEVAEPSKFEGGTEWVEPYIACDFMLRQISSFIASCQGKTWSERMKTKNFYAVMLFSLALVTTFWILVDPSPNLHTIVSETHKQISNIRNIPSNIRHTKKELLDVDKKYLKILGYPVSTVATPANYTDAEVLASEPVVVVPVLPYAYDQSQLFLSWTHKMFPDKMVVFFDLGVGGRENLLLKKACNGTKYKCEVRSFMYNKYPSHVRSHSLGSYVPICLQEVLNKYKSVIWTDPNEYFLTKDITSVVNLGRKHGIAAWVVDDPTSSITYPKMFTYFDVKPDEYYFHRAAKTDHLILFNTEKIRLQIMLPWVKCALVEECISPTGSQNSGGYCYEKKPRFLYTGCHHYEQSALNIILGKVFGYEVSSYGTREKIFGVIEFNTTSTSPLLSTDSKDFGSS